MSSHRTVVHLRISSVLRKGGGRRAPTLSSGRQDHLMLAQEHQQSQLCSVGGDEPDLRPPDTSLPLLGSLAENQIRNKGAKALARSLLVNRSLTTLE